MTRLWGLRYYPTGKLGLQWSSPTLKAKFWKGAENSFHPAKCGSFEHQATKPLSRTPLGPIGKSNRTVFLSIVGSMGIFRTLDVTDLALYVQPFVRDEYQVNGEHKGKEVSVGCRYEILTSSDHSSRTDRVVFSYCPIIHLTDHLPNLSRNLRTEVGSSIDA
jgi:hypothetical protein